MLHVAEFICALPNDHTANLGLGGIPAQEYHTMHRQWEEWEGLMGPQQPPAGESDHGEDLRSVKNIHFIQQEKNLLIYSGHSLTLYLKKI